jgi:hypothetical protein
LKSSVWSWFPVTYGSTTAIMFFSSISTMRSMRRRSICTTWSGRSGAFHAPSPVLSALYWQPMRLQIRTISATCSVVSGKTTASGLSM